MSGAAAGRVRVFLVEGDAELRHGLLGLLAGHPAVELVGSATSGRSALPRLQTHRPDLLLLDLGHGADELLALLGQLPPELAGMQRVAIASGDAEPELLRRAAAVGVLQVLVREAGAARALSGLGRDLEAVVRRALHRSAGLAAAPAAAAVLPAAAPAPAPRRGGARTPLVVGIGVSTGGPKALAELLPQLPADFPLPIAVVQHMPPKFTHSLAESLDRAARLRVREARQGEPLQRGAVLIAPGGVHLRVVRGEQGPVCDLTEDPPECSCRPSVDYLFRSLAQTFDGRAVGVVLTGMGEDGWLGAKALHRAGGCLLAQDEASSTVFGMPRGPIEAGIAAAVPLAQMAAAICQAARGLSCS